MPEFQAREKEHQQWKQAVLSGELELEEIDTDPFNFKARGKPTKKSSKEEANRNMISGAVGRPESQSI